MKTSGTRYFALIYDIFSHNITNVILKILDINKNSKLCMTLVLPFQIKRTNMIYKSHYEINCLLTAVHCNSDIAVSVYRRSEPEIDMTGDTCSSWILLLSFS